MQHRSRRIGKEALHSSVALLLQVAGDAGKRSSRACRTSESINLAFGLVPDFGPGALDMRLAVGDIVELIRPNGIFQAVCMSLGLVVVVLRVVEGDGRDGVHFCTEQPQQVNLALRLCVRHVDDQLVSLGTTDVGEPNASVSRCSLDDGASRLQQPLFLSIFDKPEGGTVLDTAAGILELGFAQDIAAGLLGETLEADEWRLANR